MHSDRRASRRRALAERVAKGDESAPEVISEEARARREDSSPPPLETIDLEQKCGSEAREVGDARRRIRSGMKEPSGAVSEVAQ